MLLRSPHGSHMQGPPWPTPPFSRCPFGLDAPPPAQTRGGLAVNATSRRPPFARSNCSPPWPSGRCTARAARPRARPRWRAGPARPTLPTSRWPSGIPTGRRATAAFAARRTSCSCPVPCVRPAASRQGRRSTSTKNSGQRSSASDATARARRRGSAAARSSASRRTPTARRVPPHERLSRG